VLAVVLPGVAWGASYYVDATNGDDGRAGTSEATAWQTLQRVSTFPFEPGDFILLQRGEMWREQLAVVRSGQEGAPITAGAYGAGDAPIINGAAPVTGWSAGSGNTYSATVTTRPEVVVFDGTKGRREALLEDLDEENEWYWADDVLTVYAASSPMNVEASVLRFALHVVGAEHVSVGGLTVQYADDAVRLYNTNHVALDGLTLRDNAGYGAVVIGVDTAEWGQGNAVRNCTISHMSGSTESMSEGGLGHGVFLWGSALCGNTTIDGNVIHDGGGGGILVLESSGNLVSNNTVHGNGFAGIVLNGITSSNNVIEKNHVYDNCHLENDCFGINIVVVGDNNVARYNICHDQHVFGDIGIPWFTERSGGIRFDGGADRGVTDKTGNKVYCNLVYNEYEGIQVYNFCNVEVYNNTIFNATRSGLYCGWNGTPECTARDNVFRNNVIHTSAEQLVWNNHAQNTVLDHNVYFPDGPAAFNWNDASCDFAGWLGYCGGEAGSQSTDPLFTDPTGLDFALQPASPCVDAGTSSGAPDTDIVGVARPQGEGMDVGAYEYTALPIASFTAAPLSGDRPLNVAFTDTSDPGTSPIVSWSWDFDNDGWEDSDEPHPTHAYTEWGTYTVSLTVTTALGEDTRTEVDLIHVTAGPTAQFSASPTWGIAPLPVDFTDASTPSGSPIVSWSWDFDDDGQEDSDEQHPTYVFSEGVYTVSLTVTAQDAQEDTRTLTDYITVDVLPSAAFSADATNGYAPMTVQFADESAAGTQPIASWHWDFGDDATSDDPDPVHVYASPGDYTVSLTVTTAAGADVETKPDYITVAPGVPPSADFAADPTMGKSPLAVQFTDLSVAGTSPITSWSWDFGDEATSDEQHPAHTYQQPGIYTVSLTVTTAVGNDVETKTDYIWVDPDMLPTAAFEAAPTSGRRPLTVSFTDLSMPGSAPITAWQWTFGDGETSEDQHPTHIYTTLGAHGVTLSVTSANGQDSETKPDYIQVFAAVFVDQNNASGVEDGTSWATAFTAIHEGIDAAWAMGGADVWVAEGVYEEARPNATGSLVLREEVHVYGGFTGVETDVDQRDWPEHETLIDGRHARGGQRAYHVVLGADNATLDGFTIRGGNANSGSGSRDRGGGMFNDGVSPAVVNCTFEGNSANYGGGGLCNVNGAAPAVANCRFDGNQAAAALFSQSYGGAMLNLSGAAPVVTNCVFYDNEAHASVLSNALGGAIYTRDSALVLMNCTFYGNGAYAGFLGDADGGALYNADASATATNCILWGDSPDEIRDQGSGSADVGYSDVEGGYAPGLEIISENPLFSDAGSGDLELGGDSPCVDRGTADGAPAADLRGVPRPMADGVDMGAYEYCPGPTAAFSAAETEGYAPFDAAFTDESSIEPLPVAHWAWDFGDDGASAAQNPVHTFESPGVYTVALTVRNAAGSDTDTKTDYITVNSGVGPTALFTANTTSGNCPLAVQFLDASLPGTSDIIDWHWDFGDGKTAVGEQHPTHVYAEEGEYTVSLTVITAGGSDTLIREDFIIVGTVLPAAGWRALTMTFVLCAFGGLLAFAGPLRDATRASRRSMQRLNARRVRN